MLKLPVTVAHTYRVVPDVIPRDEACRLFPGGPKTPLQVTVVHPPVVPGPEIWQHPVQFVPDAAILRCAAVQTELSSVCTAAHVFFHRKRHWCTPATAAAHLRWLLSPGKSAPPPPYARQQVNRKYVPHTSSKLSGPLIINYPVYLWSPTTGTMGKLIMLHKGISSSVLLFV